MKMKNLQIWNLCEYGISKTYVQDLYEKQLTLQDIENLDNEAFNQQLGKTRDKLYAHLQVLIPQVKGSFYNHTSMYCLYATNLSQRLITILLTKGLTIGQLKYASIHWFVEVKEIGKSNAMKIIQAVDTISNEIVLDTEEFEYVMNDELLLQNFKDKIYHFVKSRQDVSFDTLYEMEEFKWYPKKAEMIVQSMFDVSLLYNGSLLTILEKVEVEITLMEFIDSIQDESKKSMLAQRMSGITLEEIGQKFTITRERVRQIVQGIINRRPKLVEDHYKDTFLTYEFSKDVFCTIFEEKEMVYYYLFLTYGKGKQSIKDMVEDTTLAIEIRKRASCLAYENYFVLEDAYVLKRKQELVEYVVQKYCKKHMKLADIHIKYDDFIREHIVEEEQIHWFLDERHFDNCVANMKNCLQSYGKVARYYTFAKHDFESFLHQFNFSQYMNICISSAHLFMNYSELMEHYDIQNEFELHNVFKKLHIQTYFPQITMQRMPFIEIGNADREAMVYDALVNIAPCTIDDLAQYLYDNYGIQPDTAKANWLHNISSHLKDGLYHVDIAVLDDTSIAYFKSVLVHDFYLKSDVEAIFKEKLKDNYNEYINYRNLREIGYRLQGQYMFKYSYSSMTNYIEHLLLSQNTFDLGNFSKQLRFLPVFSEKILRLKRNFEILGYAPKKYLNIRVLYAFHITKEDLRDFCNEIYQMDVEPFFTFKMIQDKLKHHKIMQLPYDAYLFCYIIRYSGLFAYVRYHKTLVFSKAHRQIDLTMLFSYILKDRKYMLVSNLIDYLNAYYGIRITARKVIDLAQDSSLYFDSDQNTVYYNYTCFVSRIQNREIE